MVLGLLLLSAIPSWAQTTSISGTITSPDGSPESGVEVILVETQQSAVTDSLGKFSIQDVKPGDYNLTAFAFGRQTKSQKITATDKPLAIDLEIRNLEEELPEITVKAQKDNSFGITRLNAVEGMAIYAGKKSEVVVMDDVSANLATNNSRQVYAKVSGLNIWESDGAGIQLGIGGRGLNPSRVSNFNTRQNGYDMSADALGYPESYYSPPTEAIERIEIVRGSASLQYGTQFGGFINFRLKSGPDDKPVEIITRQTVGSFGLFNSFNSIGGTKKKVSYYAFYNYKTGNGWRENSSFDVHTGHANLTYRMSKKLTLGVEYTHMQYLAQQPGGLTDALFEQDPRQSIRDRNWFRVNWNLAALKLDYAITNNTGLQIINFGLHAQRDALGFLGMITRIDPREDRLLLQDQYRNFGSEARLLHRYHTGKNVSAFLIGARYYKGFTNQRQGDADAGEGPDFTFLNPSNLEQSEYDFPSENIAFFAENVFRLSSRLTVTPGLRFEHIHTQSDGYYTVQTEDLAGNIIYRDQIDDDRSNARAFLLAGIGLGYKIGKGTDLYGNVSQNYRSINFNDMRIVNPNFQVDPNLQDESGFSADLGIRGNYQDLLNFDLSIFLLQYNNRIGEVLATDTVLFAPYRLRTNISDSRSFGFESFLELDITSALGFKKAKHRVSVFSNLSAMEATYINSDEPAFEGNEVELVPAMILKSGMSYRTKKLKLTYQYSYTSSHFTDATNAKFTSNAVNGIIPSYWVMDLSAQYDYKRYSLLTGINNLADRSYFTRRAGGYPGPGIIPSDGRSVYLTVQVKI